MIDPGTTVVATAIATTIAGAVKGAKGPAQAIDDLMTIVGFGKLNEIANRKRITQQHNENLYKTEIADNINKIHEDNLQEPKLSILGPAIEASKFYIEEKELRSMFAHLVSASLDSSKNNKVHESFVELIKQLSPSDSRHLSQIFNSQINPLIDLNIESNEGGRIPLVSNLYVSDHIDLKDHTTISASLINLRRLGLVDIIPGTSYTMKSNYDQLKNHPEVLKLMNTECSPNDKITITEGVVSLTTLGLHFCEICL